MMRIARPRSRLYKRAYSRSTSRPAAKRAKPNINTVAVSRAYGKVPTRSGLGNRIYCKLHYFEKDILMGAVPVGGMGVYSFRATSLFDPNFTGIGHQPLGYDQLAALTERYIVYGCKYKVTATTRSATQNGIIGVQINDKEVPASSIRNALEQGQAEYQMITVAGSSGMTRTFSGYIDAAKVMGQSKEEYLADAANQSNHGDNPVDNVWLTVFTSDAANGTGPQLDVQVHLEMYALLLGSAQTAES